MFLQWTFRMEFCRTCCGQTGWARGRPRLRLGWRWLASALSGTLVPTGNPRSECLVFWKPVGGFSSLPQAVDRKKLNEQRGFTNTSQNILIWIILAIVIRALLVPSASVWRWCHGGPSVGAQQCRGLAVPVVDEQEEKACCYHGARFVSLEQTASKTRYRKRWNE